MFLGRFVLPVLISAGWVMAMAPRVARQDRTSFLGRQSSTSDPPLPTFDWWPFDDFETDSVSQSSSITSSLSQSTATTTSFTSSLSHTSTSPSPSPSPSIIDITALSPATSNAPHPRIRTKQNLRPFSLAPLFGFGGLLVGALVGWLAFSSYDHWMTRSNAVSLESGPAYVSVDERANRDRGELVRDVEGSPSKHTKHGTPYSSYSVRRDLLGRIPSSRFYKPPPTVRTRTNSSETSFAWPSLPGSSRSTPSYSRATAKDPTESMKTTTAVSDDPFALIGNSSTRTSTTIRSIKVKKRDERYTSSTAEPPSPTKGTPRREGSWNYPWIPRSPSAKPDSYTAVPARTSSPRFQPFRTPESSPQKPSYVRSSEKVRLVDTSILPTSPPTLTSPRLESELFLNAIVFDVPGTPTPKRTRSLRAANRVGRSEERDDTDTSIVDTTSPPLPHLGTLKSSNESRSPKTRDSRPGPTRRLSTASSSTIFEFPGDPPPKRTPAERFHARRSALNKVDEIVQRSRSQTSVASVTMSPGRSTLDAVEGDRRFGRIGKDSVNGGIEQRLLGS